MAQEVSEKMSDAWFCDANENQLNRTTTSVESEIKMGLQCLNAIRITSVKVTM